jgi:hypothetical protein
MKRYVFVRAARNAASGDTDRVTAAMVSVQSADAGYLLGQFLLGLALWRENALEPAFQMFSKSADQKYPPGMLFCAFALEKGIGTAADEKAADALYLKTAKLKLSARAHGMPIVQFAVDMARAVCVERQIKRRPRDCPLTAIDFYAIEGAAGSVPVRALPRDGQRRS